MFSWISLLTFSILQALTGIKEPHICKSCQKTVEDFSSFLAILEQTSTGMSLDNHQLPPTTSFPTDNADVKPQIHGFITVPPSHKRVFVNGKWVVVKIDPVDEKPDIKK